jgi:hypothetical protein
LRFLVFLPTATSSHKCLLLAVLSLACLGCDMGETRGQVAGKVTFQGKPVSEGFVLLSNHDKGIHVTADLKPDGSYAVRMAKGPGLPVGVYLVCVCPPPIQPKGVFDVSKIKEYPNIPQKYRNPPTSGLTLSVKCGANPLDIDMKP